MRFSPVRVLSTPHSGWLECWEPDDLLLLRKITRRLQPRIQAATSRNCFHLKGHGGAKGALQAIRRLLDTRRYSFVARSDAKDYYANIRHRILLAQVREHCDHSPTLRLVQQYCARTLVKDGYYHEVERKGISLGCPLSPLMGALYLSPLDKALENLPGVKYLRFMDDWIILAESRWKLRRAVRIMNQVLADLELDQHPDKTFIGKVSCGFDFLGVDFHPEKKDKPHLVSCKPSRVSKERLQEKLQKHFTHAARLYEQGRLKSLETIEQYLSHWLRWSKGTGIALPNALDTIKRSLNELCEETTDAMIPTFIQAMKAWMKTQEIQHEKDIINRSMPSPKESVSYFTCSLSNPISNGGRNSPHC